MPASAARETLYQYDTALLVFLVEAAGRGAVEVEHADQPPVDHDRHDQFGARGGVAGDMAGEGMDVGAIR